MSAIALEQWNELQDLLAEDFKDIVNEFISNAEASLKVIKTAYENSDNANGLEAAHALKGASLSIGANKLGELCYVLQEVCHSNMISDANNVIKDIEHEFNTVFLEVNTRLAS